MPRSAAVDCDTKSVHTTEMSAIFQHFPAADHGSTAKAHIVVVDDDPASCRLLGKVLSTLGYQSTVFSDAQQAMAEISTIRGDLILLDFQMPGLNGVEWCAALRQSPGEHATIPVIMLTAYAGEREEIAGLEAGANDFVTKPASVSVLKARIETQLRLRAMTMQLQQQNMALEQSRLEHERDLEAAQLTQRALLPVDVPVIEGWSGAAIYQPLIQVGGDVFGWEPLRNGGWLIWLADATGHGTAAALVTSLARNLFHLASETVGEDPALVLARVNQQLFEIFHGRCFMTASCMTIYPGSGNVLLASAGHPPLAIKHPDGTVDWSQDGGAMLGIQPSTSYPKESLTLDPGDLLLLYTDGIHSSLSEDGRHRTHQDLIPHFNAEGLVLDTLHRLMEAMDRDGELPFTDDVAAIAWLRE
ncbi:MAG: fused response regulator/phosphatase [Chthoniobacteraceae bacterium]